VINRAFLIDRLLRPSGIGLFLLSPHEVTSPAEVPGYTVEGDEFVASRKPMPRINANWTYGTRRLINLGMGYKRFKRWAAENQIGIYVPYAFSELVSNKRKTYEVLREIDSSLHPHTEDFIGALPQVESFLDRSDTVFIKPRSGNRGNDIFVLRRGPGGISLKYYGQGAQRLFSSLDLPEALGVVQAAAGGKSYVIQQGIECARADGSVFDIRVVMVNDGSRWHSIFETRLAPPGSDLSNIFQGGSIRVTETLLCDLYGEQAARVLEEEIRCTSHRIAQHLETLYPGELIEMGFDFLLDRERRLHLVEVNAKPGVAGFGSEVILFEWGAEDEAHCRRWVYPHVTHLAGFLKTKAEKVLLSET
jgi:glutathione synthase/RimK-type ligase-like ATP-grasp enzyme